MPSQRMAPRCRRRQQGKKLSFGVENENAILLIESGASPALKLIAFANEIWAEDGSMMALFARDESASAGVEVCSRSWRDVQ